MMKTGYSIAWAEGTFLTQQHFQYWDDTIKESQLCVMQTLLPYAYGLIACVWDTSGLGQGVFQVKTLRWRTAQGDVLCHDHSAMPLLQCHIGLKEACDVYLVAHTQGCHGLSGYPESNHDPRFHVEYHAVSDSFDTSKIQEVALKRFHLSLVAATSRPQTTFAYPIARLKYRIGNAFELDQDFMPTSIQVNACEGLAQLIQRLIRGMTDKLASTQQQLDKKWDVQLHLEAIQWSHCLVDLTEIQRHGTAHPHTVYVLLAKLVQQAYLLKPGAVQIPAYDHERLHDVMQAMEMLVQTVWGVDRIREEEKITLTRQDDCHYVTGAVPRDAIETCDWYLGVSVAQDDLAWIKQFIQQVKVSPQENLDSILMSALPGIGLQHVQRPPSSVRLRSGYEYFKLKKHDAYWESFLNHGHVTVYLPKPFHTAALTLDVVKE